MKFINTRRSLVVSAVSLPVVAWANSAFASDALSSSGSTLSSTTSARRATDIRVVWQPSAGASPYFYAKKNGLFSKYHLNVSDLKVNTGPAELPLLASNSADVAYMGGPPAVAGMAQDIGIKFIYAAYDVATTEGLYIRPTLNVSSIEDVVGKSIAVTRGNTAHVALLLALKKQGLPLDAIKLMYMDSSKMLPAYDRGDIDGAWVTSTWGERLKQLGAVRAFYESKYGVSIPSGWVVTEKFLNEQPVAVANFIFALNQAAIAVNLDPKSVSSELADVTGVTKEQAEMNLADVHFLTIDDMLVDEGGLSFLASNGIAQSLSNLSSELALMNLIPRPLSLEEVRSLVDYKSLQAAKALKFN